MSLMCPDAGKSGPERGCCSSDVRDVLVEPVDVFTADDIVGLFCTS